MKKLFLIAAVLVICLAGTLIIPMAGKRAAAADLLTEEQKQEAVSLCFHVISGWGPRDFRVGPA